MPTPPPTPAVTNAIRIQNGISSLNPDATFVIVTKTQPIEVIRALFEAGYRDFGENRVEQFVERQNLFPEGKWHFIGHLSRKNVAKVVGRAELIHSVGSRKLLEKIERSCEAAEKTMEPERQQSFYEAEGEGGSVDRTRHNKTTRGGGVRQRVLLQVNVSGEGVKQGFESDELLEFVGSFDEETFPHVQVEGLMTMAPFTSDASILRPCFTGLRELRDEINEKYGLNWNELSMGMSNDYRIALEEGATIVRIGTAVFE